MKKFETKALRCATVLSVMLPTDVVAEEHRRPEFTQALSRAIVVEGAPAKFECKVTGSPQPEIQW
jgi:hypothetical protein